MREIRLSLLIHIIQRRNSLIYFYHTIRVNHVFILFWWHGVNMSYLSTFFLECVCMVFVVKKLYLYMTWLNTYSVPIHRSNKKVVVSPTHVRSSAWFWIRKLSNSLIPLSSMHTAFNISYGNVILLYPTYYSSIISKVVNVFYSW